MDRVLPPLWFVNGIPGRVRALHVDDLAAVLRVAPDAEALVPALGEAIECEQRTSQLDPRDAELCISADGPGMGHGVVEHPLEARSPAMPSEDQSEPEQTEPTSGVESQPDPEVERWAKRMDADPDC